MNFVEESVFQKQDFDGVMSCAPYDEMSGTFRKVEGQSRVQYSLKNVELIVGTEFY